MSDISTILGNFRPEPWVEDALCAETGGDMHYPDAGETAQAAKAICNLCDVRYECLLYALRTEERWGVWGGMSERARRKLISTGIARRLLAEAERKVS